MGGWQSPRWKDQWSLRLLLSVGLGLYVGLTLAVDKQASYHIRIRDAAENTERGQSFVVGGGERERAH